MKYTILMHASDSFSLYTELGGYANIYYEDGCWRTQYYNDDWRVVHPDEARTSVIRYWDGEIHRPDAKTLLMVFILDAIEYLHGHISADDLVLVGSFEKLQEAL